MGRPKSTKVAKQAKVQSKKRIANASLSQGSQAEKDLVLLWMCFENSEGIKEGQTTIDYRALGKALGISRLTAKARYYSLRTRIQKMKAVVTKDDGLEDQLLDTENEPGEETESKEEQEGQQTNMSEDI